MADNLFIKNKRLSIDLFPKKFMNSMIEREKPDYDDIIVKHIVKLIKTNPTLNGKYFSATKYRKYSLEKLSLCDSECIENRHSLAIC